MKLKLTETQYNEVRDTLLSINTHTTKQKKMISTLLKILSNNIEILPVDSNILEKEEERDVLLTNLSYLRRDIITELTHTIKNNYKEIEREIENMKISITDEVKENIIDDIDDNDIKELMYIVESDNNDALKTMEKCERARKLIKEQNNNEMTEIKVSEEKAVFNYFSNL